MPLIILAVILLLVFRHKSDDLTIEEMILMDELDEED